jgi:hypothetical protein
MFWKLAIAIGAAVAASFVPVLAKYWFWILLLGLVIAFVIEGVRIVPQQSAWVIERLGRFHGTLEPGLNLIIPFLDRVAYVHSLKEVPLDVPEQICITKDNTQLTVDGILYYQVTDPRLASYGSSNYVAAISQLAQTTLRSEIGKMELDKTFESRDDINRQIVHSLDEAGRNWGIKVLRYDRRAREARADREVGGPAPGRDQPRRRREAGRGPQVRRREAGRDQQGAGRCDGDPGDCRGERGGGAGGGRGDRRQGRDGRGEPQGGATICRRLRAPRQDLQHVDSSG